MQHYAAFHLGLYCLQKYPFRGFPEYKGSRETIGKSGTMPSTSLHPVLEEHKGSHSKETSAV